MTDYRISEDAVIGNNCRFGENVVVEDGARLGDGVVLGHGAVVLPGTRLGDGVEVEANAELGKRPRSGVASRKGSRESGPLEVGAGSFIGASAVLHSGTTLAVDCYVGDLAALREGCDIGEGALIGRLVAIEENVVVGERTRVLTGAYLAGETEVAGEVFIGPKVITTNDRFMSMWKDKVYRGPTIETLAAVGAGASILSGATVGREAVVGMGAVVLSDVPPRRVFVGVPARDAGEVRST